MAASTAVHWSLVCVTMFTTVLSSNIDGDFWNMQPYYRRIFTNTSGSQAAEERAGQGHVVSPSSSFSDLILAVPDGAVIGILPKLGWLIYEGDNNEEVDFRLESEFLYRFPRSRTSEVGLERSLTSSHLEQYQDESPHQRAHRQRRAIRDSRLVRDKRLIYRGLGRMFRNFGMDGEECTRRAICEISSSPLLHDGIIGELLNIALIPSHKYGEGAGLDEYREAEKIGHEGGDCGSVYKSCPVSMFRTLQL